jgi:hypothetical protein
MTNSILRFLTAMLLVAFSVTSAMADEDDECAENGQIQLNAYYCRDNKGTNPSASCAYIDRCLKSQTASEGVEKVLLAAGISRQAMFQYIGNRGSTSTPVPQFALTPAERPPVVVTQPIASIASATPANFDGPALQGAFPTSMYPAKPGREWKSIGEWPNTAPWGEACAELVRKTAGLINALPEEACILFKEGSRGLVPVNGSINCTIGMISNGVKIDGQVYGEGGRTVWTNITVNLPEGANRRTKVCHAGTFGDRDLYILQPEGCTNYSYLWVSRHNSPGPCERRKVIALIYDYRKLTDDLRQRAVDLVSERRQLLAKRNCSFGRYDPRVSCELGPDLYAALKARQVSLSTNRYTFKVSLVEEGVNRQIISEETIEHSYQNGALTFYVPLSMKGKVIRVVVNNGEFLSPFTVAGSQMPEERCKSWYPAPGRCEKPLYLSFITKP